MIVNLEPLSELDSLDERTGRFAVPEEEHVMNTLKFIWSLAQNKGVEALIRAKDSLQTSRSEVIHRLQHVVQGVRIACELIRLLKSKEH